MSNFPSLAEVLATHQAAEYSWGVDGCEHPCKWDGPGEAHPAHQAQMWQESCVINTVEQMDSLQADPIGCEGAIVKDADGDIWESEDDGSWSMLGAGEDRQSQSLVALPAQLLWHPGWVSK